MNKFIATGTALVALTLAAASGMSTAARADDSINQVNDSQVQLRQMDYLRSHGGYMLLQDQQSQSVGGRNSTMIVPAPQVYVPVYSVEPGPVMVAPSGGYIAQ
ncbi:hypothetical protein [Xanthobacter sp. VNH20]|uniref:hypothetical protein n=1 Tax=Xanthobacteraceae TaxID=335928 RepID=UPI0032B3FD7E